MGKAQHRNDTLDQLLGPRDRRFALQLSCAHGTFISPFNNAQETLDRGCP